MKLCIWNDRCYRLIDDGLCLFDATIFTVVRKLFVRWNTDGSNAKDEILSAFRPFGDIESVEIVSDAASIHVHDDGEFPVTHEAYVSFGKSEHAYEALIRFYSKNMVYLAPADTWHQPDYDGSKDKLDKITIDCDHKCDMDPVTHEFNNLSLSEYANGMLCERTVVSFELEMKPSMLLNHIRRVLQGAMQFVADLTLTFFADECKKLDKWNWIDTCDYQRRVIEVIAKNTRGPKLTTLSLNGLGVVPQTMLEWLAPIFQPLTDLTINTIHCNILYLLPSLCPNLVSLRISGHKWEGVGGDVPLQLWPTLKELGVRGISLGVDSDTTTGKRFRDFVSLNPQLETLEMDIIVDQSLLKAIGESMRNLKYLKCSRLNFDGVGGVLDQMVHLKHLESIYVNTMYLQTNHFGSLLSCVERLSKEEGLKMATLVQNYIVNTAEPLFIEADVPIKYHDDCPCHGKNRVIAFKDGSQNDVVNLPKHKPVLAIMVNVARHLKLADSTLDSHIRTLFAATKKFYPNVLKTTVVEEPTRFVYVHISSIDSGN